MSKQLHLTDQVKSFLDTADKEIWDLILTNRISDLLAILPRTAKEEKKELDEANAVFDKIVGELFSVEKSDTLDSFDFVTIKLSNSSLMSKLVQLLYVLDINGNYEDIRKVLIQKISGVSQAIVEKIQNEANGYPANPISGLVWMESAAMRTSFNNLAYYYLLKDELEKQYFFVVMRTRITLAIMGHYKNLVGPDMIESAQLLEKLGETDNAFSYYEAVKADFEDELDWFLANPESGPNEEDCITLQSLEEAYRSIDRLNNSNEFDTKYVQIEEVLSREYIEEENPNEE